MADRWNQLAAWDHRHCAWHCNPARALAPYLAREEAEERRGLQSQCNRACHAADRALRGGALFYRDGLCADLHGRARLSLRRMRASQGMVVKGLVVVGLPAYVLVKVLTPNFFARKDTRTPVITAAIWLW